MASEQLAELVKYSACDISDALLKLDVVGAGFLPDIAPLNTTEKLAAPATTVLFSHKSIPATSSPTSVDGNTINALRHDTVSSNIPAGAVWSDLTTPGSFAVLSQPAGSSTATMGGCHAARLKKIGVRGVLVDGRVRDVKFLRNNLHLPVWSKSTSLVATKAECKAVAINVPIQIGKTKINEGDIILLDPDENGALCIPKDKVNAVLELVPKSVEADEKMIADILLGLKVEDATKKYNK